LAVPYRIYVLNHRDEGGMEITEEFRRDEDALSHASTLLSAGYAAEVWHEDRLVARLGGHYEVGPRGSGPAGSGG
jgi:hypothetical protein